MGAIENIAKHFEFMEALEEKMRAAKWLRNNVAPNVSIEQIFEWFDLMDNDMFLTIEDVVKYMQTEEPEQRDTILENQA